MRARRAEVLPVRALQARYRQKTRHCKTATEIALVEEQLWSRSRLREAVAAVGMRRYSLAQIDQDYTAIKRFMFSTTATWSQRY